MLCWLTISKNKSNHPGAVLQVPTYMRFFTPREVLVAHQDVILCIDWAKGTLLLVNAIPAYTSGITSPTACLQLMGSQNDR